ncbi:MAG: hypothetical protein WBF18_04705, partial [Solirubrobacterales bacterium]
SRAAALRPGRPIHSRNRPFGRRLGTYGHRREDLPAAIDELLADAVLSDRLDSQGRAKTGSSGFSVAVSSALMARSSLRC